MEERDPATTIGPITPAERQYVLDLLRTTQWQLNESVAGLSEAQYLYSPCPERWSILACVEHIVAVERAIARTVQMSIKMAADPIRRATVKVSDLHVVKSVRSRKVTVTSPPPFEPRGRFTDLATAIVTFNCQRNAAIAYVEVAPDDLRLHYFQHFVLGTLDTYQGILLVASHGERHRKQIEEIKACENFPVA
jgi:hypothetical protein